jgi:tetratricopeptide (TPR) repeat protein
MPAGKLEHRLLMSAVELSDALGDDELGYESRLRLCACAAATGDSTTRLRAFDRCLELHLHDPFRFPASIGALDLLWEFASIPRMLASSPRYDRETIAGCFDEMVEVFSRHGADLRAFELARFEASVVLGDEGSAAKSLRSATDHLLPAGAANDRAESLLCSACVLSGELAWHADQGRPDRAAAVADRLRASEAACASEPELGLSRASLPYLLAGRTADAEAVHREGYELARQDPVHLEAVAGHIVFAVTVGALRRARILVERHLHWLASDPLAESAHFAFLCAAAGAMDALTRSGRGALVVSLEKADVLPEHLGSRVGPWAAASLARACWAAASALADRFDRRNGNAQFARRLDRAKAVTTVATWEPPDALERDRAERPEPKSENRDMAPGELLCRAREHAAVGDFAGADRMIDAALARSEPVVRADLFALRIRMRIERGDLAGACETLERRLECLDIDGLADEAALDRAFGLSLFGAPVKSHVAELEAALAQSSTPRIRVVMTLAGLWMTQQRFADAEELLSRELAGVRDTSRSAALFLLADARFALGRPDGVLEAIDLLLTDPIDRALRAFALLRRATVLFLHPPERAREDLARAVDDADRALNLFATLDHCEGVLDTCGVLGVLLSRVGSVEGALEALRTAHHTARRFEHPDAGAIAFRLACALVRVEQGAEARTLLEDAFERESQTTRSQMAPDTSPAAAELLHWLGHACRQDDDDPAAYGVWSVALEEFTRAHDAHGSARTGRGGGRRGRGRRGPEAGPRRDGTRTAIDEGGRRTRTGRHPCARCPASTRTRSVRSR